MNTAFLSSLKVKTSAASSAGFKIRLPRNSYRAGTANCQDILHRQPVIGKFFSEVPRVDDEAIV
jgi:hypothetical protein